MTTVLQPLLVILDVAIDGGSIGKRKVNSLNMGAKVRACQAPAELFFCEEKGDRNIKGPNKRENHLRGP